MITQETVAHVARLARLALTPEEEAQYTQELGKILALVDQLSALDLSGNDLALTSEHPTSFRDDEPTHLYDREALLANAPQEEEGFFRVPRILDEGS